MKANGKADLYFHAYFWEIYLKSLSKLMKKGGDDILAEPFMKRLIGLSLTLTKVIVNIKKFPFHEKMYLKYCKEFGQRNTSKKMKYLEEI